MRVQPLGKNELALLGMAVAMTAVMGTWTRAVMHTSVASEPAIEVLVMNVHEYEDSILIYVRNLGPGNLTLTDPGDPSKDWFVALGEVVGEVGSSYLQAPQADAFAEDEVVGFKVTFAGKVHLSALQFYKLRVYGPGGTETVFLYSPR